MPAVRFSRDKRGYEYTYLVHTPTRRGKSGRTRVLYWYRTPPGVRIGRQAFDPDVQKLIEQQNPGVTFDWQAIVNTPIPPPDMTEYWRERRRLEKAARQERRAMEASEASPEAGSDDEQGAADESPADATGADPASSDVSMSESPVQSESAEAGGTAPAADGTSTPAESGTGPKKRRRRRGGRRRKPDGESGRSQDASGGDPGAGDAPGDEAGGPSDGDEPSSEEE